MIHRFSELGPACPDRRRAGRAPAGGCRRQRHVPGPLDGGALVTDEACGSGARLTREPAHLGAVVGVTDPVVQPRLIPGSGDVEVRPVRARADGVVADLVKGEASSMSARPRSPPLSSHRGRRIAVRPGQVPHGQPSGPSVLAGTRFTASEAARHGQQSDDQQPANRCLSGRSGAALGVGVVEVTGAVRKPVPPRVGAGGRSGRRWRARVRRQAEGVRGTGDPPCCRRRVLVSWSCSCGTHESMCA